MPKQIELSSFVRASNQFGLNLINELNPSSEPPVEPKNVLFSPLGMVTSLAMLYQGADGQTAQQLESALGFDPTMDKSQIPQTVLENTNLINSSSSIFRMANALLVQNGFTLSEAYVKMIQDYFNANVFASGSPVDFNDLNKVIANKTDNMINQALKAVPSEMCMMLINVVYFRGKWMYPFFEDKSHTDTFYGINEVKYENITFMSTFERFGFVSLYDLESDMVEIPLEGDSIALYAILPRDPNDDLSDIRSGLNVSYIESMINNLSYRHQSTIMFPRLNLDQEYNQMSDLLSKLGITEVFNSADAKFSTMSSQPLHLNQVVHRSRLDLCENGEKSSKTFDDIESALGAMAKPLLFEFNHPFFYFLRHKQTGQIFLMGEVHKF